MGAQADYEICEECGSCLIQDFQDRIFCKLCGWTKKDPTNSDKIPSYIG